MDRHRVRLALLGDSIAYGVGADRPEDTLAVRLPAGLEEVGVATETRVLAWPGARSANLRRQVQRARAWQPDLALIIIGANDLTHQVPVSEAADGLRRAVRALREADVAVVLAPAPDLSVVPLVPPALRAVARARSEELRRAQLEAVRDDDVRVADADGGTSTSFGVDASLFSRDRFHPSSAGYARIAEALAPVIRSLVLERDPR